MPRRERDYVVSSGNVFADLSLPNAEEALAKAELAHKIAVVIRERGLTQVQAAERLGLDQDFRPDSWTSFRFSMDRLLRFLLLLGQDIRITVQACPRVQAASNGFLNYVSRKNSDIIPMSEFLVHRFSRFVLCVVCVSNAASVSYSATIPTEKWQKFSSPVAGFSILMPGEARESIGGPRVDAAYGDERSYSAEVGSDAGSFTVTVHVFVDPIEKTKEASFNLDRFQEVAARNLAGKIVSQRNVSIGGMSARRVSITSAVPGLTYTVDELFVVKDNRLFRLSVMVGAASLSPDDVDKFFGSLSITGPAKEWKRSRSDPNEVVEKDHPEPAQLTTGVTSLDCPTYPPFAKQNHIGGIVTINVTIDSNGITGFKTKGLPVLAQASEANVRTWKFAADAPKVFTVTYTYVQEGEYEPDPVFNCRAKLELPNKVEVSANW